MRFANDYISFVFVVFYILGKARQVYWYSTIQRQGDSECYRDIKTEEIKSMI